MMLYPAVASWWNGMHQSHAVALYIEQVARIDDAGYADVLEAARRYNDDLARRGGAWFLTDGQRADYLSQLDVADNGVMAYLEIPAIGCYLPVYHGTDPAVLQVGVGHMEWSSLPVGGEGTHAVLSGHCGLPDARLFTDLDELRLGDRFIVHVLAENLTYEVDQVLTVLPSEVDALGIAEGEDYCTLLTCTPYGVNTHRLLVRGRRVRDAPAATVATAVPDVAGSSGDAAVGVSQAGDGGGALAGDRARGASEPASSAGFASGGPLGGVPTAVVGFLRSPYAVLAALVSATLAIAALLVACIRVVRSPSR